MYRVLRLAVVLLALVAVVVAQSRRLSSGSHSDAEVEIGREIAVARHLEDGEEFETSIRDLIAHGEKLFAANWTVQEGGGRPLTKGTGARVSDPGDPLVFPRNFNRISAPDANSCAGCHNSPFGVAGGSGDFVSSVFVLGQRFDFATFDHSDPTPTRGSKDERGVDTVLQTIANQRATIGMFGSGYIEMLARQITADLQAIRDATLPGGSNALVSRTISFGRIARDAAGNWITSGVEGLPATSLVTTAPDDPPSLIIRPFHQAGAVVSLREFTNNAFNHHHGIQSTERFGLGTDPDGDGFVNELTRADVTASAVHQATMAVPGRVIPTVPAVEEAVRVGEAKFVEIGCAQCHMPRLPLDQAGWIFTEPNPYNPRRNLQVGTVESLAVDLTSDELPLPRLQPEGDGVVYVPAFTDLKLHDISLDSDEAHTEPLDMNEPAGSTEFFAGNRKFLTARLWGAANQPPYFHHGQFTTMREAILAHAGEALVSRTAFEALDDYEQDSIVEFLKTLQVLPPGTEHRIVDQDYRQRSWTSPGAGAISGHVYLQSRNAHQDIEITIDSKAAATGSDGRYWIGSVLAGTYTIRADKERYLPAEKTGVDVLDAGLTTLPDLYLRGGDANEDSRINLFDLVLVGASYDVAPPADPRGDINADGICDVLDLALVGGNYRLVGPTAWPATPAGLAPDAPRPQSVAVELTPAIWELPQADAITPVDLRVRDVAGLYAADVELAFDPARIEIVDQDPQVPGVQIRPAMEAQPSYVLSAAADHERGRIRLVFTLTRPATPLSGDTLLARI